MFRIIPLSLAAMVLGGLSGTSSAAESYDNCTGFINSVPATIVTQGTWCLNKDLGTGMASGAAITVNTNNVTIDCNDFKLGGLAAGTGTLTIGIQANSRYNLTVRQCNIRGFNRGVATTNGGGHRIENNRFDSNTLRGIDIQSPGSVIRGNLVIDTGGSTSSAAAAYGINAADGVDIIDNTVIGVAPGGTNANAFGIGSNFNGDGSINSNRVRGLAANGTGLAFGIYNTNSGRIVVRDNDVQGTGSTGSIGIRCITDQGTARGNIISGFNTSIQNCLSSNNTMNTN
ncbi:right-handed parallel beta-helix repeat-containing protein [Marilutibacter alkalisoli]|uniref:Right handed beta helix domain-containing protein n=1 Tax=Marilutibacter alkalisoli TaxID=2591633 RepID=A0A514BVJ9_9GAMM|nr:right-handed parallel beta-helix repeat-containing protein [Lysobacter alkalisoli]QDH71414.1 hypothetical protein FKV23_15925 [Lysobacter alkalisoli]